MKLRIIDYQFPRGGVERLIEGVLNALPENDIEVSVFTAAFALQGYRDLAERIARPIDVVDRPTLVHRTALAEGNAIGFSWMQIFETPPSFWEGADLVWFPAVQRHVFQTRSLSRTVATLHDAIPVEFGDYMADRRDPVGRTGQIYLLAIDDLMTRRLLKSSARTVVDAERTRDYLLARYAPLRRPEVVYLSAAHIRATRPEPIGHLPLPPRFVLYPANTSPHKNHHGLLAALAQVKTAQPEHFMPLVLTGGATAAIASGGDHRSDRLRELIADLQLEVGRDLFLLGGLSDGQLRSVLARADGLIFPTLAEGYGLPPMEAATLGIPVACSDIPVMQETLGRLSIPTLWFDAGSVEATAGALASLSRDQDELRRRAEIAVSKIQDTTWEDVAQRYVTLFHEQAAYADLQQRYL